MRNRLLERMAHVMAYAGLVIADRSETIWWVNRAFAEMMGYSYNPADGSSDLIGQKIYVLILPESRKRHTELFQAHVDNPAPGIWIGPVTTVKKNGETIQVKIKPGSVTHIGDRLMASTNVLQVDNEGNFMDG